MLPMSASALMSFSSVASSVVFSPTRSACVRRAVAPCRFRYEPYAAKVLTPQPLSSWPLLGEMPMKFTPYPYPDHDRNALSSSAGASASSSSSTCCFSSPPPSPAPAPMAAVQLVAPKVVLPPPSPVIAAKSVPAPRYAIVKFKHESATFLAPFKISAGDLVVVEGDRGENIGVVSEITKALPAYDVPSKVLRRATDKDREALAAQRERETAAMLSTRALAESLGLHGRVEDAEYQFDLNKLTIFVRRPSKSTFVDFRKLQRSLFREFRCRIWCAYMDEVEAAEAAPRCK